MQASAGQTVHSSTYAQQQHQQDISLKELMPSEVMVNNYVDDLLQREAEMLFNIQGTFSARPDSFVGGYSNFLNNALQLYGAPPLVAQSLASLEGKRNADPSLVGARTSASTRPCPRVCLSGCWRRARGLRASI